MRVELDALVIEVGQGTGENLVSFVEDGELFLLKGVGELANFLFELVINLATLIRENVETLEATTHILGHSHDHLDHFLFHFAFLLANLEKRLVLSGCCVCHLIFCVFFFKDD